MSVFRVGIIVAYRPGETAQMACALADYLEQLGCRVDILSGTPLGRTVHHRWDNRARRCPQEGKDFLDWIKQRQRVIWFDIMPMHLAVAQGVHTCRQIGVPIWHQLTPDTISCLPGFDRLVVPCEALATQLSRAGLVDVQSCSWDSGGMVQPVRQGPCQDGQLRVLVLLTRDVMERMSLQLMAAMCVLLERHDGLSFTLASDARWSPIFVEAFDTLPIMLRSRFRGIRDLSHERRRMEIRQHDWVFCANARPASGLAVIESLNLGVPVLTYDIPPYNEVLVHAYNGARLFLEGERDENHFGAPLVRPNAHILLEGLDQVLGGEQFLRHVQTRTWNLENNRRAFRQIWQREVLQLDEEVAAG